MGLPSAVRVFLSTCPVRGTTRGKKPLNYWRIISIHVPREGHDFELYYQVAGFFISIHVPREGHDSHGASYARERLYFYPRAP